MRRALIQSCVGVLLILCVMGRHGFVSGASPVGDLLLWFDSPATQFTQSLPLGNGRLGAMVFGGVGMERIILNESSLWSGSPEDADRPDAAKYLPEIRRLLLEGKNAEAEKLVYDHFTCQGRGSGYGSGKDVPYGSYQTLGDLKLMFPQTGEVTRYRRELNLADATARVQYELGGVTYSREAFVSAPDQAIVIRLTASKPGSIKFFASLNRSERSVTSLERRPDRMASGLLMSGQLNNGTDGYGMKYAVRLRVVNKGGHVSGAGVSEGGGDAIFVQNADEVVLLVTAATDYMGFAGRKTPNPVMA